MLFKSRLFSDGYVFLCLLPFPLTLPNLPKLLKFLKLLKILIFPHLFKLLKFLKALNSLNSLPLPNHLSLKITP